VATILIIFLFAQLLITFICVLKSLNDEERGGNCLLMPERSYGPDCIIFKNGHYCTDIVRPD